MSQTKLFRIICSIAAANAFQDWQLSPQQCNQIPKTKPKSVILTCPLLSITSDPSLTLKENCKTAGCCYTKQRGKEYCWTDKHTIDAQKAERTRLKDEVDRKLAEEAAEEAFEIASNANSEGNDDEEDGEHRTYQLISFGNNFNQNRQQSVRLSDNEQCLASIKQELLTKGKDSSCVSKVDFAARVTCDVSEIRSIFPNMSLCSACLRAGCCYDPTPRIINSALAPMCFYSHRANVAPSDIENDLMSSFEEPEPTQPALSEEQLYTQGIMKEHGHATVAPDMMGIKYQPKRDNRYQNWIKQNYNVGSENKEEEKPEEISAAAQKMQELFKNNPRLAGKLGHMGISTSTQSKPSMATANTDNSNMSDRMKSFMSMYGGKPGSSGGSRPSMPAMNIPGMSGLSSMMGMSSPSKGGSSSDSYMDNIRQQFLGGSSSGSSSSPDRLSILQNLMSGNAKRTSATPSAGGNSKLDMIKQMMAQRENGSNSKAPSSAAELMMQMMNKNKQTQTNKPSVTSGSSTALIISTPEEDEEPQFNSAMHANMYKQMMASFKTNLARMNKSPAAAQKDLDTFKKTVLKRFDKYLIKTTTAAPVTTVAPDADFVDTVEEDTNMQVGSAFDYGQETSNFVPFDFERFMIGNDEPNNCYPQQCGVPELDSIDYLNTMKKIVGGTTAGSPAFWPWQVSIRRIYENTVNFSHLCGGTLISSKWIITAAHCFIKYTALYYQDGVMEDRIDQYMIHVGRYHKSEVRGEEGLQMRTLEKYIAHENFSPTAKNQVNDIALAKMLYDVEITEHVKPVCLPSSDAPPREGDRMWITGWGDDMNIGPDNEVLKELSLPVASVEMCKNDWKSYYNEGWICSDRAYKEDACTGDSGGPAVHKTRDGRWRIVGITAAGSMKCSTTQASVKAGVFTNVAKFRQWIDTNTGGMC